MTWTSTWTPAVENPRSSCPFGAPTSTPRPDGPNIGQAPRKRSYGAGAAAVPHPGATWRPVATITSGDAVAVDPATRRLVRHTCLLHPVGQIMSGGYGLTL